jgi:hypothetical protein
MDDRQVYVQGDVTKTPTNAKWCVTNAPTLQQTLVSSGWHIARESEIQQLQTAGVQLGVPGFEGLYGQGAQGRTATETAKEIPKTTRQ